MKIVIALALVVSVLTAGAAHADTSKSVVRIACVPEAGLLDVASRELHDSVSSGAHNAAERDAVLARAGFHDPHGLTVSCQLGDVTYVVTAEQDETSNKICGGDPEVYLTVQRNGHPFLHHVVFGTSCNALPSVTRMTVGDGPNSWRSRETQVCYANGAAVEPAHCDWTFGEQAAFDKRFPLDQQRVAHIATHAERR